MCLIKQVVVDFNASKILNKDDIDRAIVLFYRYIELLVEWAKTHNIVSSLFGVKNIEEEVLDSLLGSICLKLEGEVYDAGSGGGLPGIPMALLYPATTFHLIESDRKKCSFLRAVKSELNLSNIKIHNVRIESFQNLPFIVSKAAFAPKNMFLLSNCLAVDGFLALWSTPRTAEEYKKEAQKLNLSVVKEDSYEIPQEKKRRVMIFKRA